MPKLRLISKGKPIREYRIDPEMSSTIGRMIQNDVVIEDPAVSRVHASIRFWEGKYLLSDIKSKNGTFVNNIRITSHWLNHGDVLLFGDHHIVFLCDDDMAYPETIIGERCISLDTQESSTSNDGRTVPPASVTDAEEKGAAILRFLAGGKEAVTLTKELTRVGKDSSCDVIVHGLLIGRVAFIIERRAAGYYLSYVGGVAVPKVCGQAVRKSMKLEEMDVIEIGAVRLQFTSSGA